MCPPLDSLSCGEVGLLLEAYLDGELDPTERSSVDSHLQSCTGCSEELRLAEEIARGLRSMGRFEPPLEVLDRVSVAGDVPRALVGPRSRGFFANPRRAWAGLAAAATVLLALGTAAWQERHRPLHPDPSVRRATAEARVALAYVGLAGQRAAEELKTGLLRDAVVKPTLHGLSLQSQQTDGPAPDHSAGPVAPPTPTTRKRS